jgi:hypothetical protein
VENEDVLQALRVLIRGDGVRRASHELKVEGRDLSDEFRSLLKSEGYEEIRVEDVPIRPGERVPAFHVDGGQAHFGWIFWELFSEKRKRKLFGSQAKNEKGDWTLVLVHNARVYASLSRIELMDVERPSSL